MNFPQQHRVRCSDQQLLLTLPGIKANVMKQAFEGQKIYLINQVDVPSHCAVALQQVPGTMFFVCSIHNHFLPKEHSTWLPAGERNLCEYARDLYCGDPIFQVPSARTQCHCPSKVVMWRDISISSPSPIFTTLLLPYHTASYFYLPGL